MKRLVVQSNVSDDVALEKRLSRAAAKLALLHPYFGGLCLQLPRYLDDSVKTARTNGSEIRFNRSYIDGMTDHRLQGLLAHEVAHVTLLHHVRRGARDPRRWNLACDYAGNALLVDEGIDIGESRHDPRYSGMSAEQIYSHLPEDEKDQSEDETQGEVTDPNDIPAAQAQATLLVLQGLKAAKLVGSVSSGLERLIRSSLAPSVPWRDLLLRFCQQVAANDFSWLRPNRRYLHQGIILPTLQSVSMGEIVVALDTSGSIGEEELSAFAAAIEDVRLACDPERIHVLYIDAAICGEETFERGDPIVLRASGGGGTSFVPAFTWVEQQAMEPACLIYLTDGHGEYPSAEPSYPTLWAMTSNRTAPFGEHVAFSI